MKRRFLPLFLCFFISFSLFSNTLESSFLEIDNDTDYNTFQLNSSFSTNLISPNLLVNNQYDSTIDNTTNNTLFLYNSERTVEGGIHLNRVFSYNIIARDEMISSASFSPIQIQGNLFSLGLFYGFMLTVVVLNVICSAVFNEKLYARFAASIAAFTVLFFFSDGLFHMIGVNSLLKSQLFQSGLLFVTIGVSILFASKYLSLKDFYPKLKNIAISLMGISLLLIITAWIKNDNFIAILANTLLFTTFSLYFLSGVLLFSKKNYAKFYVIGTFIPLLFSIDYFVLQPFGVDFLFTKPIHLKVATLIEVLLLSYAILFRMKAIKEESELRNTEMRIFLKRQDLMSRTKVEQLVEDVYLENLIMQYDLDGFEIKLLQYISEGKANTKIARKLKITEDEVIDSTKELYQKLEISEHIQEDYRMVDSQPDYIYN